MTPTPPSVSVTSAMLARNAVMEVKMLPTSSASSTVSQMCTAPGSSGSKE